jgi:hypothetical protein
MLGSNRANHSTTRGIYWQRRIYRRIEDFYRASKKSDPVKRARCRTRVPVAKSETSGAPDPEHHRMIGGVIPSLL